MNQNIQYPYHLVDADTDPMGQQRYRVTLCDDDSQAVSEALLTRADAVFVASCLNRGICSPALDALLDGRAPAPVIH